MARVVHSSGEALFSCDLPELGIAVVSISQINCELEKPAHVLQAPKFASMLLRTINVFGSKLLIT